MRPTFRNPGDPASALLEVMVHLEIDFEDLPSTYQLVEIDLPNDVAQEAVSIADCRENLARLEG